MKISEILTESKQLDELDIKQGINKVATGAGKALGGVGKAVGAVAGIPQGVGRAIKKGYNASVQTIGGDPIASTPAATRSAPTGTANKPAAASRQSTFDKLSTAAFGGDPQQSTTDVGTVYSQVKSQLDQLNKRDKQRLLAQLQKSLGEPAAVTTQPALVQQPITQKKVVAKAPATKRTLSKQKVSTAPVKPAAATNRSGSLQSLIQQQIAARDARKTAAGGTVTKTPTGMVHTAKK